MAYKSIEDFITIQYVPKDWTGCENPEVTVTLKRGKYDEFDEKALKSCIGEALLRFGALTQIPFTAEIKP